MGNTRQTNQCRVSASRTPGSLGRFDAADPDWIADAGDTPGAIGLCSDRSAQMCCNRPFSFQSGPSYEAPPPEAEQEEAVWIFPTKQFIEVASTIANYTSTAMDSATWKKLLADFGLKGKYYIKTYKGKEYIIFKGYAGLREKITGTRYLLNNTKVVNMAIGKAGVIKSGVRGGVVTIVLVWAVDIIDYFLRDEATLSELGVKMFVDLTKTVISTAIGTVAAMLAAGASAPIIVPLGVAIAVGVAVSLGLDYLDKKFELSKKLQAWVDEQVAEANRTLEDLRARVNAAGQRALDAIETLRRLGRAVEDAAEAVEQMRREYERLRRLFRTPLPTF